MVTPRYQHVASRPRGIKWPRFVPNRVFCATFLLLDRDKPAPTLPVGYFHLVFTLPAEIVPIAYQNKTVVYDLLFRPAAETLLTLAADPKHLGARIGATASARRPRSRGWPAPAPTLS